MNNIVSPFGLAFHIAQLGVKLVRQCGTYGYGNDDRKTNCGAGKYELLSPRAPLVFVSPESPEVVVL